MVHKVATPTHVQHTTASPWCLSMQLSSHRACSPLALVNRGRMACCRLADRCESTVGAPHPGKLRMNIEIKPTTILHQLKRDWKSEVSKIDGFLFGRSSGDAISPSCEHSTSRVPGVQGAEPLGIKPAEYQTTVYCIKQYPNLSHSKQYQTSHTECLLFSLSHTEMLGENQQAGRTDEHQTEESTVKPGVNRP